MHDELITQDVTSKLSSFISVNTVNLCVQSLTNLSLKQNPMPHMHRCLACRILQYKGKLVKTPTVKYHFSKLSIQQRLLDYDFQENIKKNIDIFCV